MQLCLYSVMGNELDNKKESTDVISLELEAIIAEQTARQTKITHRQDAAIAAIAENVLKLTKKGESSDGQCDYWYGVGNIKYSSIKFNFLRFSGEDPEGGLYQVDKYFAFHGIGDDSKVQITGFHMMGKALSWIRDLRRNNLISTWTRFVVDLWEHFGVADYVNKLELSRLQQTSSLTDYLDKFEDWLNDVEEQSESMLITYFVRGLRADLKSELKILNPKTLQQAFAAAKVYDTHLGRRHLS